MALTGITVQHAVDGYSRLIFGDSPFRCGDFNAYVRIRIRQMASQPLVQEVESLRGYGRCRG